MGSPSTNASTSASPHDQPPVKPNPFRPSAVIATVFGAIGTGATIVGGGILMSFHKLTVDDDHTRRAAGITTVVVGAIMIPPTLIIGAYDAYRYWKWRQWMAAHRQADGVVATADAPVAPQGPSSTTQASSQHIETTQQNTTSYDYPDDEQHVQSVQPVQIVQVVTVS